MKKLYDLCVITSRYTQNGQEKKRYENIGSVIEKDGRPFMTLKAHFNPAAIARQEGSENIFVSMFTPKDNNSRDDSNSRENTSSQEQWDGNVHNAGYDVDDNAPIPF